MSAAAVFGGRVDPAAIARPALLVVDVSRGFTEAGSPFVCDLDEPVKAIADLLDAARAGDAPVIFTSVAYDGEGDRRAARSYLTKVPRLAMLEAGSRWVEIDPRIAPADGELVVTKLFPSAFFGTPLASLLAAERCDAVVVCGASTSGCVRATVVDAMQHGYHVLVPREAVGDRDGRAHEQALADIEGRYGDVVSAGAAAEILGGGGDRG